MTKSHSMDTPAIEFDQLTRCFGARRAVDSLSFAVNRGEIFGFLGRNGAGKTTTIRCLLGLARPTSGDVRIFGKSIVNNRVAALEATGALVETAALYDYLSSTDHLRACAPLAGSNISDTNINDILERVGLGGRGDDRVSTFSRGMKQRLALATALLGNPRLVVLDEPTDGLDPIGTVEIRKILRDLKSGGTTIFLSSHLLAEVGETCDRIATIDVGRLRAVASVAEIGGGREIEEFFMKSVAAGSRT